MRISDWSSDVCSSDLPEAADFARITPAYTAVPSATRRLSRPLRRAFDYYDGSVAMQVRQAVLFRRSRSYASEESRRSEEHTSELQSLMRISYAVFCLKKKKTETMKPTTK